MIFTRKSLDRRFSTVDIIKWSKKFALLPVPVSINDTGMVQYVWLEWYETKTYYKKPEGWHEENRLLGSINSYKVHSKF
jgi:hypothetical protein